MSKKSGKGGAEGDGQDQSIKYGLDIASSGVGSGAGALLGALVAGPPGALLGGIAGKVVEIALSTVCKEILARQLGRREVIRVNTVAGVVIHEIRRRIEAGDSVRADDFFDVKLADRSDAEEVAESVILKVQREPEERKIPYMGYLLSGIIFDAEIGAQLAHQLTKIAEQLTYRQLCILKLAVMKDEYELRDRDYRDHSDFGKDLCQILYECAELYDKQYINYRGEADLHNREYMDYGATIAGLTNAIPSRMTLQGIGEDLSIS